MSDLETKPSDSTAAGAQVNPVENKFTE